MERRIDFWSLYTGEQRKAYEVGRRVSFTKVKSLTYGLGFRDVAIEQAFRLGITHEEAATERAVSTDVGEWNITIERMFSDLRSLEQIGRDIPGDYGARRRKMADKIRRALADAYIWT